MFCQERRSIMSEIYEKNVIIGGLIEKVKGQFAAEGQTADIAQRAYDMGVQYAQTRRFDNSRYYHNYKFQLDDGTTIMATSFFNIFMSRNQTCAYMDAEKALKVFFTDARQQDAIFHLVRDQRFGINGVFKAIMSPQEPQQLNYIDFVLVIACFCAGVVIVDLPLFI